VLLSSWSTSSTLSTESTVVAACRARFTPGPSEGGGEEGEGECSRSRLFVDGFALVDSVLLVLVGSGGEAVGEGVARAGTMGRLTRVRVDGGFTGSGSALGYDLDRGVGASYLDVVDKMMSSGLCVCCIVCVCVR
jgi:hypothetical protein